MSLENVQVVYALSPVISFFKRLIIILFVLVFLLLSTRLWPGGKPVASSSILNFELLDPRQKSESVTCHIEKKYINKKIKAKYPSTAYALCIMHYYGQQLCRDINLDHHLDLVRDRIVGRMKEWHFTLVSLRSIRFH